MTASSRPCQAKDPSKCRKHGTTEHAVSRAYIEAQEAYQAVAVAQLEGNSKKYNEAYEVLAKANHNLRNWEKKLKEEQISGLLATEVVVDGDTTDVEIAKRTEEIKAVRKQVRKELFKDMFRTGVTTSSAVQGHGEFAAPEVEAGLEAEKHFLETEQYRNVKKMPALFVINRDIHMATDTVNEKGAWVFEEPSRVTLKRDGTGVTVTEDGKVYARRTVKKGRPVPPGFLLAELDTFTGHQFGLEPVEQSGFHKMFKEAAEGFDGKIPPGTYELCGPKLAGNPEKLEKHVLMPHGTEEAVEIPDMREIPKEEAYERLKPIFEDYKRRGIEGVVWWGADGKRTKLRVYDYWGDPNRR